MSGRQIYGSGNDAAYMKPAKVISVLKRVCGTAVYVCLACMFLAIVLPVFVCDQFRIGGESMWPTLESGDHVLVNKLHLFHVEHFSVQREYLLPATAG